MVFQITREAKFTELFSAASKFEIFENLDSVNHLQDKVPPYKAQNNTKPENEIFVSFILKIVWNWFRKLSV